METENNVGSKYSEELTLMTLITHTAMSPILVLVLVLSSRTM